MPLISWIFFFILFVTLVSLNLGFTLSGSVCFSIGSVLTNRESCAFLAPECGLRQCDPLSPYLFILSEEVLSLNIAKMVRLGDIHPILSSSISLPMSHLLFEDDILLFLGASPSSVSKLANLLSSYQDSSSQHSALQY